MEHDRKRTPNETHLGYIQATITRMGQNAFQAKTWCITIITARLIFLLEKASDHSKFTTIYIAIGVVALFCTLDTYYLYLERGYRKLYKIAAGLVPELPESEKLSDYDMQIPNIGRGIKEYGKAFLSVSTGLFYGLIIVLLLVLRLCTNVAEIPST